MRLSRALPIPMTSDKSWQRFATRELALLVVLLLVGLLLLPAVIFFVGKAVFGAYGGHGYAGFFGDLGTKISRGAPWAWFLVLSPYLAWQTIRAMVAGWRAAAPAQRAAGRHQSGHRGV